jgi:steroid delta-isomerase-like uncharacterized protein
MSQNTQERNKQLCRQWFEQVWNQRNYNVVNQLAHPNARAWGFTEHPGQVTTIADFKPFWEKFLKAFPDLHITVDDVIAEGDKTCTRITAKGRHTGQGLGIPPTGRPINISALILVEWRDGKIHQAWNEFDAYGMMQQLAGPPAPAAASHAAVAPHAPQPPAHTMKVKI